MIKYMVKKILLIMTLNLILFVTDIAAYDSDYVHPQVNEKASRVSPNLKTVLQNLGYAKGVDDSFGINTSKRLFDYFRDGGTKEDSPIYRAFNHFHDPLKSWDSAGLSGSWLGTSSLIWAQDQSLLGVTVGGDWSWKKARDVFYEGLTTTDKTTREQKLANSFRALGQVMHLIADSSVPAHTRNDIHVFPLELFGVDIGKRQTYESWAKKNHAKLTYTGISISQSIFNQAVSNSSASIPISALWDQDKYTGSSISNVVGTNIGLAEYSNANFFSEDTIFKNYSHPSYDDTNYQLAKNNPVAVDAEDGRIDNRIYIKKTVGEVDNYLAAFSYVSYDCIKKGYIQYSPFVLDDKVYTDYAALLLPRAVGYSAGLLDYFFRGTLEITFPDQFVYAIADGSGTHQFTKLKAKVKNTTSDEAIQSGILQAIARYKKRTDYQTDLSTDPPTPDSRETDFSYSVSSSVSITSLSSTESTEFTFDFTSDLIPAGITDLYLNVIFKGTLGNETDNAIAIGMKDLDEPTHISIWNSTDRFYLDGVLRTADEIRKDPALLARVDHNGDGTPDEQIDPYPITAKLAFSSTSTTPTTYPITYTNMPDGRYGRIIILTGTGTTSTFYMHGRDEADTPDYPYEYYYIYYGVTNQVY
jgi:hypothetical protein